MHLEARTITPNGHGYSELLSDVHLPTTLLPTALMIAIAATTIRPAIKAYSSTSPPCSSLTNFANRFFIAFMVSPVRRPTFLATASGQDLWGSCRRVQAIAAKASSHDQACRNAFRLHGSYRKVMCGAEEVSSQKDLRTLDRVPHNFTSQKSTDSSGALP